MTAATAAADPATRTPGYLDRLADADEYAATDMAIAPARRGRAGERGCCSTWSRPPVRGGRAVGAQQWSVAQEHAATHISEQVVAAVCRA